MAQIKIEPSKIFPLRAVAVKARPITSNALSWSTDAELAVAATDSIHIFLPGLCHPIFIPITSHAHDDAQGGTASDAAAAEEIVHGEHEITPQYTLSHRIAGVFRPDPLMNAKLCASHGVKLPLPKPGDDTSFKGVGSGLVTGSGGGINQVIRVEWSPSGLGCNLRPILAAQMTHGHLMMFGEFEEVKSTMDSLSMRGRSFKYWRVLWGLGAFLPVPDPMAKGKWIITDEKITSFAWAREIAPGRALLAYQNDEDDVVIVSVRHHNPNIAKTDASRSEDPIWCVDEVARFEATNPHKTSQPEATDFVPGQTVLSLKWSPWVSTEGGRTATLAYMCKNSVSFRRVVMYGDWKLEEVPQIQIDPRDTITVCSFLTADAMLEWEDQIWEEGGVHLGRGVFTTPFAVKPFQVPLTGPMGNPVEPHSTTQCSTTYPAPGERSTNPITGLLVHRPDPSNKPTVPLYTLTRLSATAGNQDWYQTNDETCPAPQWATQILRSVTRVTDRGAALTGAAIHPESSESEDAEGETDDEYVEEARVAEQIQAKNNINNKKGQPAPPRIEVNPYRYRIWGMARSPGGGSTVALVSKHSTLHPSRRALCSLMFGWHQRSSNREPVRAAVGGPDTLPQKMTTEGKVWELMYGSATTTLLAPARDRDSMTRSAPDTLQDELAEIFALQQCIFCASTFQRVKDQAHCGNGHSFATCPTTGLAITKPGVSRVCGVCDRRSLKISEIVKLATSRDRAEGGSPTLPIHELSQTCGACHGKFLI